MATQQRRELLRHMGLKLLEHAAVEVREYTDGWGNKLPIAVVKNPPAGAAIWLGDPAALDEESWEHLRRPDGTLSEDLKNFLSAHLLSDAVYAYADMQVRVEGMYFQPEIDGRLTVFGVTKYGEQTMTVLRRGTASDQRMRSGGKFDYVDLSRYRRATMRDVPRDQRMGMVLAYAQMVAGRREPYSDGMARVQDMTQRFTELMGVNGYGQRVSSTRVAGWRGDVLGSSGVYPYEYLRLKRDMARLGRMVSEDDDAQEFLDAFDIAQQEAPHLNAFAHNIARGWNAVHPDDEIVHCSCGHLERTTDVTHGVHSATICRTCIDDGEWLRIEDLGQYDLASNAYQHDDGLYYSYAQDDDDDDDDDDDYERVRGIRSYSTDVRAYLGADYDIKSSAYGEFLMGIELEVVPNGDRKAATQDTLVKLAPGYAILKSDGSLDEGGFEIVTAPRGLREHIARFNKWTPYPTLRAWDARCCGTHVHISSEAFTASTLGKFIELINSNKNDEFIREIAGRHPKWDGQAQDYCQRDGCTPGNPKKTLEGKCPDRYFMVNTTNVTVEEAERLGLNESHANGKAQNTIELRVFRASLKKARLLAQIEFAHAAVMFCRWSSMRELDKEHFLLWLRDMAGVYPHLAKWFGVRGNKKTVEQLPQIRMTEDV